MIKKLIALTIICIQVLPLQATDQTIIPKMESASEVDTNQQNRTQPLNEIGLEDAPAQKPIENSNLQNWFFAAGTIVIGTIAAIIVGSSQGSSSPGTIN